MKILTSILTFLAIQTSTPATAFLMKSSNESISDSSTPLIHCRPFGYALRISLSLDNTFLTASISNVVGKIEGASLTGSVENLENRVESWGLKKITFQMDSNSEIIGFPEFATIGQNGGVQGLDLNGPLDKIVVEPGHLYRSQSARLTMLANGKSWSTDKCVVYTSTVERLPAL